jgi:hypothetical protein
MTQRNGDPVYVVARLVETSGTASSASFTRIFQRHEAQAAGAATVQSQKMEGLGTLAGGIARFQQHPGDHSRLHEQAGEHAGKAP